ncbi:Acetyltransferase, GNAT family [Granulibacter bethesdensis]|uniref:GNAT family N-acetyltransferase n=1 Tax=Granulibacter bethesdensis TaxID=364410 RepID=UPI00090C3876|nr:Acetyltransferase, GNAT family [Granulibacter bethesdensis]
MAPRPPSHIVLSTARWSVEDGAERSPALAAVAPLADLIPAGRILRTGRLLLYPVTYADLPDLCRIKADPGVFAIMLGGVRNSLQAAEDLAADIAFWGQHNVGMWAVRDAHTGHFEGLTGLMGRPDGRGMSIRFAFWPEARGRGYAREAAGAALRYAHDVAGVERVIGVAREENWGSRMVLGSIGMRHADSFMRDGYRMLVYESWRMGRPPA